MIVNACMYGETKGYLYLHMTDTNLGLVIYVITFFLVSKSHISAFLGVFGWGGGSKGGRRESIGELQIFSKASDGVFFFGVSRDLLPSFVHMWRWGYLIK